MRHIPEAELHAYLDQALSRSQCVEIESHLAQCSSCSDLRDAIAALRDRTTALLSRLGPPTFLPPPFDSVRHEANQRVAERREQWRNRALWAASLLLAVTLGWQVNGWVHPGDRLGGSSILAAAPETTTTPLAEPVSQIEPNPVPDALTSFDRGLPSHAARRAEASRPGFRVHPATATDTEGRHLTPSGSVAGLPEQPSVEISALASEPAPAVVPQQGLWRTVSLDEASDPNGTQFPRVPGLPVLQVQVQPTEAGTEITAVDQQLATGELIRTIEGPAARVSTLLTQDDGEQMTLTVRQGDRMLAVTGPSTVLGALMSKVTSRKRY